MLSVSNLLAGSRRGRHGGTTRCQRARLSQNEAPAPIFAKSLAFRHLFTHSSAWVAAYRGTDVSLHDATGPHQCRSKLSKALEARVIGRAVDLGPSIQSPSTGKLSHASISDTNIASKESIEVEGRKCRFEKIRPMSVRPDGRISIATGTPPFGIARH